MAQSAEMERAMAEAEKHKAEMLEAAPPEQRKTLEQMMREPGEETP